MLKALLRHSKHELWEASDGGEAKALALAHRPDVIISDIVMPTLDGYQLAYELASNYEFCGHSFILYSATYLPSEAKVLAAVCGVRFFLTKPTDPILLLHTVSEVLKLGMTKREPVCTRDEFLGLHARLTSDKLAEKVAELDRQIAGRRSMEAENEKLVEELKSAAAGSETSVGKSDILNPLSAREREVLLHLTTGLSNREIAEILFVGEGTVKTHVEHIIRKLGVNDRFKAAAWGFRHGFLPPESVGD